VKEQDPATQRIIGCAIEVHRALGPGLLESAYEQCLAHELTLQGLEFQLQAPVPLSYKAVRLDCGYKIDVLVSGVVVELKCVERLLPIHEAQLLTYMKLVGRNTGLLINFNERRLADGIRRFKL
jgi:GxxExxY protein